jgi:simple sugar transport system permease protein
VGIAIGALLWGFLDNSAQILNLRDVPVEIVQITQGVIVLSVVVAYELVRRYRVSAVQRDVGRKLSQDPPSGGDGPSAAPATQGASA